MGQTGERDHGDEGHHLPGHLLHKCEGQGTEVEGEGLLEMDGVGDRDRRAGDALHVLHLIYEGAQELIERVQTGRPDGIEPSFALPADEDPGQLVRDGEREGHLRVGRVVGRRDGGEGGVVL